MRGIFYDRALKIKPYMGKVKRALEEELRKPEISIYREYKKHRRPLLLSSLLYLTAALGKKRCDFGRLLSLGVALELLDVAVDRHYSGNFSFLQDDNSSLVIGDYYYARAILLTAPLGSEVVSALAKAVEDISRFFVEEKTLEFPADVKSGFLRRASLYRTAALLGSFFGGVSEDLACELKNLASLLGLFYIFFVKEKGSYGRADKLRDLIEKSFAKISDAYFRKRVADLFSLSEVKL